MQAAALGLLVLVTWFLCVVFVGGHGRCDGLRGCAPFKFKRGVRWSNARETSGSENASVEGEERTRVARAEGIGLMRSPYAFGENFGSSVYFRVGQYIIHNII